MRNLEAIYKAAFTLRGRELHLDNGCVLLVCHRTNSTPKKSPVFLMDITDPLNRQHVSSLYGDEFEWADVRYRITRTGDRGEIQPLYVRRRPVKPSRRDRASVPPSDARGRPRASRSL